MGHLVFPSACCKECLTITNEFISSAEFAYDFLVWDVLYNLIEHTVPVTLVRLIGTYIKFGEVDIFLMHFLLKWLEIRGCCCVATAV
jgi:hypothetical protein